MHFCDITATLNNNINRENRIFPKILGDTAIRYILFGAQFLFLTVGRFLSHHSNLLQNTVKKNLWLFVCLRD